MEEVKKNYYEVGMSENPADWVWSNSAFKTIIPSIGGHPLTAKKFFTEGLNVKKSYFEKGDLFHKYMENPETFAISSVPRPSEKLEEVTDMLISFYESAKRTDDLYVMEEEVFEDLLFQYCQEVGFQKKWGKDAIIKNYKNVVYPYFKEVVNNSDKHIIPAAMKESLDKAIESIKNNKSIQDLLNLENFEVYKEFEIYFNFYNVKAKSKIDRLHINKNEKTAIIFDYKTTNDSVTNFNKTFENLGYYRQQFFYDYAVRQWLISQGYDVKEWKVMFYFIVVETSNNYASSIAICSGNFFYEYNNLASLEFCEGLTVIETCNKNGWDSFKVKMENDYENFIPILPTANSILNKRNFILPDGDDINFEKKVSFFKAKSVLQVFENYEPLTNIKPAGSA